MFRNIKVRWLIVPALGAMLLQAAATGADAERRTVSKVQPIYPAIARQMNLSGKVKIEVVIAANGSVKSLKPLGGHPLLIQSASEALRRWRYVPGPETTTIVEFQFHRD